MAGLLETPGIEWSCPEDTQDCMEGETGVSYSTSAAVWRVGEDPAGDEPPTVVLESTEKRHCHPTFWAPDGRPEVQVRQFESSGYAGRAEPEGVTSPYLARPRAER